ncbi:hypothetical protein K469DRAFT_746795 [Zopfia rhizophila CBS 207.26]|uniref:Zn(2)-C6 fungal-type domain-containing protein n=1 Tax=Zopfia rhizophila CBS 207.26 TaxID=1314779 RepID=A0A6A6EJC0_9PEZI|nr:hypothetical protein K469DRAFT_746795 [Zopfia rhizophila CBS 207.26]
MQTQPTCARQDSKSPSSDFQYGQLRSPPTSQTITDPRLIGSPVRYISNPSDYPRKRASKACEVCRVRKVRCDARKPGCGTCIKLGITCSYATVRNNRPEQDAAGLFLNKLDARLDRLEAKLDQSLNSNPAAPSFNHVTFSVPTPTPQHPFPNGPTSPSSPVTTRLLGYDHIGLPFGFLIHLANHKVAPTFQSLEFDESEVYLEREIAQGKDLYQAGVPGALDLSPRLCGRFLQSFSRNVLTWFPIFDQQSFSKLAAKSYTHHFDQSDPETCLILLMLSLGALSKAKDLTSDDPHQFPGLNYFLSACKALNMGITPGYSLIEMQCQILISLYLLLSLRPLQASNAIFLASRSVLTLLNLRSRLSVDAQLRECCHRAYWVCFILEHELKLHVCYGNPPLPLVHEAVPLPLSHYDEPCMFWFLAEISMRRLYTLAHESIWKEPHVTYEPKVIEVLEQQVSKWYDGLPPSVKFPKDLSLLLDPQRAFLRTQYFALRWVIHWPAVVRLVTKEPDSEKQQADLLMSSSEVIRYAITHILSSESLLQERHPLMFANILGTYYSTMVLLITHRAPALESVQNVGARAAILKGHAMLGIWAANPGVASNIRRLEEQMAVNGLRSTQDPATNCSTWAAAEWVQPVSVPKKDMVNGTSDSKASSGVDVVAEQGPSVARIGFEMTMERFLGRDLTELPRTSREGCSNM